MTEQPTSGPGEARVPVMTPPEIVPDWLINFAALGWRVFVIAALAVLLWFLVSILWVVSASIAVAVVIAAFFAPFVVRLRARGRSRTAAAAIVWVVAIGVLTGVALVLAIALVPYLVDVVENIQAGVADLQVALANANVPPQASQAVQDAVGALRSASGDVVSQIAANVAGVVTVVILAAFLVFFFLQDGDRAWVWIFQNASDQKRERITSAGDDALWRVGGYLRGTTILSAVIAVTDYVFMWVLGVPLALPLAILVFLSGYIPYFGGIVTTFIILGVTYAALGSSAVIVMLVLIAIRNAILGYGVRPAVYGRTVSIHPALVLIALPAGFELAGIVGLFAAVPVTAIVLAVASATVEIVDPGPRPELPALVPAWLDRVAQWSWRFLIALGLIAMIVGIFVEMPLVFIPVLIAVILAATLETGVKALIRRGQSRGRAAGIAVGGGFLAVAALLTLTFLSLVNQATSLEAGTSSGADTVNSAAGGSLGLVTQAISQGGAATVQAVIAVGQGAASIAVIIILSTLLSFYFLRDGDRLWSKVLGRARTDAAPELNAAGSRAFDVLGGYMVGTAAISFVGAASQFVIMVVLGIPFALPVFVLSFFLCFIPYIGGFISTGIAFLLTVAFGSTTDIVIMGLWTLVFNLVTGNIVGPLVYGKTVHLHPAVVLVAIPAGGAVAGILGMFLVVPLLGVVAATWRTVLAIIGLRRAPAPNEAMALSPPEVPTELPEADPAGA